MATLTRTEQVLKVLRHGGHTTLTPGANLWTLFDRTGRRVPAWQAAIKRARNTIRENLQAASAEYIASAKEKGYRVLAYHAPCCGTEIQTIAPETPGEVWDTLVVCTACDCLHMKIVDYDKAYGRFPAPAPEAGT